MQERVFKQTKKLHDFKLARARWQSHNMPILIPTLGRCDKQLTYNNLPAKYRDRVTFIVQKHEYDTMQQLYPNVRALPEDIKRIAPTREWIHNEYKHTQYWVFDDDLDFIVKEPNPDPDGTKWLTRKMTDEDFDDAFQLVNEWITEGIVYGGFMPTWIFPDVEAWPVRENQRIMTNVFYNGPHMPQDIHWCRVEAAEDFDVNLQLLTKGFKNRVSSKYMVSCSATQSDGGCSTWRTLEIHNHAQMRLAALWPEFVKTNKKLVTSGPWKGQHKIVTRISHNRAYESGKGKHLNRFLHLFTES